MVIADAFTKPAEVERYLSILCYRFFLSVSAVFYAGNLTDGVCRVSWEKADSSAGFDILAVSMAAIMLSAGYFLSYLATIESPHFSYAFLGNGVILLLATVQMVLSL